MTDPTPSGLAGLRFACQTYSWQMSLDRYRGRYEHMIAAAAAAGFTGFEPELVMLGDSWTTAGLAECLESHGLSLAALAVALPWAGEEETSGERDDADRAIATAAALPGSRLVLVLVALPRPARPGPAELLAAQRRTMRCLAAVAQRAAEHGVRCTFHPNSPPGSLFRTAADYEVMADLLPDLIGYTPDVGHIANGGMDPLAVLRTWGDRVDHVHIKDRAAEGAWAATGQGTVDIDGVLGLLAGRSFPGWVTFEDESASAQADPDGAASANGAFVRSRTQPGHDLGPAR